jgi:hypothetical protein
MRIVRTLRIAVTTVTERIMNARTQMRFAHASERAERWKPVVGFEQWYEVSDMGRVRSSRRGGLRILRPGLSTGGHLSVALGRGNTRMVHALVLAAFVGPRPPGADSRHLDGNYINNRLDNLSWGTRSENIRDAIRHGTWESEKRAAGRRSPANLASLARARAGQDRAVLLAALARGRQTMRERR